MKQLFTSLFLLAVALSGFAQEAQGETTVFDFTTADNFAKCSQTSLRYDHDAYDVWQRSTYTGYVSMYNYNLREGYYEDYLVSPELDLEAGSMYVVYYKPTCYSSSNADMSKCSVMLGQGDNLASYTLLATADKLPYETYADPAPEHEVTFTVPATGKYHVAFLAGPYSIYLKTAKVCDRGQSAKPLAPVDFALAPDPSGALSINVSFTMPTATLTGQALTDPAYNLFRGVQKIKNAVKAAPGEKISIDEKRGESGVVVYSVEIVDGTETSDRLTLESYVGPETPTAPAGISFTLADDGSFDVKWDAPATGVHGVSLEPSRLSYTVTRYLDGEPIVVATDIRSTSFNDNFTFDGIKMLHYSVSAKYGATPGDAATSASLKIGTADLPFADSFAGAVISPLWDNQAVTSSSNMTYLWQAKEKMESRMLTCDPYDNDGGLLCYNSYNIQRGNSARLSTPSIKFNDGDKPVLSFAMFHIANGTDELKIQISADYGEWIDVTDAVFTPKGDAVNAWTLHNVELSQAIPAGAKTYRVGLLAVSSYGQDMVIDAVRVFNLLAKDLEVTSVAIPENHIAGNNATFRVKVSNNGSTDVAAADYSLAVDTEFPDAIDLGELKPIPSLGFAEYEVSVPVNSLHATAASSYDFNVTVTYPGDMNPANDSGLATMSLDFAEGTGATGLDGKRLDDGSINLTWTPANDPDYQPVSIAESFEDESFAEDFTGPFNGWTVIDIDGSNGGTWYSASGSMFNLCKNVSTPGSTKDGSNVLGVTVESNKQQDDWIISPVIDCKEGSTMTLDFLMGVKQISSYGNTYNVELLYTTDTDFDILNPINTFTRSAGSKITSSSSSDRVLPHDNKMYPLSFTGIPAEARRVALHFTAKGSYTPAMWVDNIRLTEVDANPLLGYHIYSINDGGRINSEMIAPSATSYTIPAAASTFASTRNVFVSAVYPAGEASPSNMLDLNGELTGIESVAVDTVDADTDAEYYTIQGVRVEASSLASGIYIKRVGSKASKILVR